MIIKCHACGKEIDDTMLRLLGLSLLCPRCTEKAWRKIAYEINKDIIRLEEKEPIF